MPRRQFHQNNDDIGTKTTRRKLVAGAITGLIASGGVTGSVTAQPAPKVNVCHLTEDGTHNLISVNGNALDAHLAHGDKLPHPVYGCADGCITTEVFVDANVHYRRGAGLRLKVGPFYQVDTVRFEAAGQVANYSFGPDGNAGFCNPNGHLPGQNFNCGGALFYSYSPTATDDASVRWLGSDQTLDFTENDVYLYLFVEESGPKSGGYDVNITTCWD